MDEPILPNVFATNPLSGSSNGSMWTIWYELWCYALVAVIGLLGILKRARLVFCCFLFMIAVYVTSDVVAMLPLQPGTVRQLKSFFSGTLANIRAPYLMMFFAAGCCFWAYKDRIPRGPGYAVAAVLGLIIACFAGRLAFHIALPVLGVYLLFWIAFNPSIPLQRFGANGDFSYGLYLYAWPVTQLLIYLAPVKWSPLLLFPATFACTLPLAIASWFLVERPFIQRKKSATARPIEPARPVEPTPHEPALALSSHEH
jgi:peptidoglycan/LPS O-acetylase OafA/YrhL